LSELIASLAGEGTLTIFVMPGLVLGIHVLSFTRKAKAWMAGTSPQLSGSFFVDKAHGVDSSVLKRLATF
jgi:hypothetical protein